MRFGLKHDFREAAVRRLSFSDPQKSHFTSKVRTFAWSCQLQSVFEG